VSIPHVHVYAMLHVHVFMLHVHVSMLHAHAVSMLHIHAARQ
jgi:hypothetical protein